MSPPELEGLWRVGYISDPLNFTPSNLCSWSHRFDDAERRFRSVYAATAAETALREVLADLRPNAAAIARFVAAHGSEAEAELPPPVVTEVWRRQNVLAPARVDLDGSELLDLGNQQVTTMLEERHAGLLDEYGVEHLDLHEITTRTRVVTQTIATDAYDNLAVGVIRFPSSRDGQPCFAVLEGRASLQPTGEPLPLTDPPPPALVVVADEWHLELEAAP